MLCINEIPQETLKNKRVLLRVDFNVPMNNYIIEDNLRIKSALKTINYLIESKAIVIIISHLGRPKCYDPQLSLFYIKDELTYLLNKEVNFCHDVVGIQACETVKNAIPGDVILLENVRFMPQELKADNDFAIQLASFGDLYVNEAFSVSHRNHTSVSLLPKLLPSYAGFEFAKELKFLNMYIKNDSLHKTHDNNDELYSINKNKAKCDLNNKQCQCNDQTSSCDNKNSSYHNENSNHSAGVFGKCDTSFDIFCCDSFGHCGICSPKELKNKKMCIVGGSKLETKINILKHLTTKVDYIAIGGVIGFIFSCFLTKKLHLFEENVYKDICNEIFDIAKKHNCKIIVPSDFLYNLKCSDSFDKIDFNKINDIGNESTLKILQYLDLCNSVLWNGPLGVYENEPFSFSSNKIARKIAQLTQEKKIISIVGGGNTLSFLKSINLKDKFSYVSNAGGALLEFIEGKTLPGIAALET